MYSKPSWQSGTGVPNDSARDLPDVSLLAAGYVICEMDANSYYGGNSSSCDLTSPYPYLDFQVVGGTSASVQAFAGIMAMVNQRHGCQGNANYVLYPLAAQSGKTCVSNTAAVGEIPCVFYDITTGNNSVICAGGSPNCSNTNSGQYGIMVKGNSPAYSTTSGYDLATGLGSVNVANLVNNWKSNFTTSNTTLSLSTSPATNPITLTHGQPVNFTVNVTSGGETPAGDVSLIAQTGSSSSSATGIGPFTLSGGSASGSTLMLPGGSYSVTAHYAGNGTFAASDSTPGIPVTVGKESSLTELRLVTLSATAPPAYNVTSVPYGSPYFLRMDVTNSGGQLCAPAGASGQQFSTAYACPTGKLTVSPAPTDLNPPATTVPGSYTLNSQGYAEDQPIQQSPGVYNFVASYAGDNSYTSSTSPTVPITITKAPTTVTITSLPSSSVGGNVILPVSVNTQSNGVAPTGTLLVLNNGASLSSSGYLIGTPYSASSGTYAGINTNINVSLPAGTDTITMQYSGDPNYAGSTSAPLTITVTDYGMSANPPTITIPAAGKSGTSTITVTPVSGFTGTINLSCDTGFVGVNCTISPSSVNVTGPSAVTATLTVTTTGPVGAMLAAPGRNVPSSYHLPVVWLWKLVGLLALTLFVGLAAVRRHAPGWMIAAAFLVLGVWGACGGGGGGGGSSPPASSGASLQPTSLSFGQQGTGSSSAAQSVTLTNSGNAVLSISNIGLSGANSGDFAQTNSCGSSVVAGANCAILVTFKPTAAGLRSASLTVTDNASGSPQTVALTGTAFDAPIVSFTPPSLTLGPENIDLTTAPQTVTLSNIGSGLLSISNITFANGDWDDFNQSNNCG